jgi:hypothetical protein
MARGRFTLDTLAALIVDEFVAVREEIGGLRQELRPELHQQVGSLRNEMGSLRQEMMAGFARIERKLDSTIERVDDHQVRLVRLERRRRQ